MIISELSYTLVNNVQIYILLIFFLDSMEQIDSYIRLVIQGSPPNEERQIQNISERENQQRESPINYTKPNSPGTNKCRILKIS